MAPDPLPLSPICDFLHRPSEHWIRRSHDEQGIGDYERAVWMGGRYFLFWIRAFRSTKQFDAAQIGSASMDCADSRRLGTYCADDWINPLGAATVCFAILVGRGGGRIFSRGRALSDLLVQATAAGTVRCDVSDWFASKQH